LGQAVSGAAAPLIRALRVAGYSEKNQEVNAGVKHVIVNRSIHQVYRYALPAIILGQIVVMYTATQKPALWMRIAHAMLT
jgi:hypothetical protein